MEENVIKLSFKKMDTRIGGFPLGEATFNEQVKNYIDYNKKNIIVFPDQIIKVASSFTQGFFSQIVKDIGYEGIDKLIIIKASSNELEEDIKADLFC